jgi:hypothetical protein
MTTVNSSLIGVNLTAYQAAADGPLFALGTTVQGTDGSLWEYVCPLSAIAQYNAVCIDADNHASNLTTTNAVEVKRVGVAQISIAVSGYGWVQRSGKMRVNVAQACQDFVALFTTGTPGVLDDATISEALVLGLNTVSSSSTASALTAIGASPLQIFPFANPA